MIRERGRAIWSALGQDVVAEVTAREAASVFRRLGMLASEAQVQLGGEDVLGSLMHAIVLARESGHGQAEASLLVQVGDVARQAAEVARLRAATRSPGA